MMYRIYYFSKGLPALSQRTLRVMGRNDTNKSKAVGDIPEPERVSRSFENEPKLVGGCNTK
jgi:hypothetical protein